ncbi:MAG: phosphatase PAP2 family protein [Anaerolineales bacterium]|nr:phosphatase PAP2 family protein [Anaerolineales bacterium]
MQGCSEWGVDAVVWLQGNFAFLQPLMRGLTFLGSSEFLLLLGLAVYWCLDGKAGARLGLLLMAGSSIGSLLKLAFHLPRPYWCGLRVEPLAGESGYGMPSLHTLNAWAAAPWLGARLRRGAGFAIGAALAAGISLSRMMLGVHFPQDVFAGIAAGALVWVGVDLGIRFLGPVLVRGGILIQLAVAAAGSAALLMAQTAVLAMIAPAADPAQWADNAARINAILPRSPDSIVSLAGLILGLGTGLACQRRWAPFSAGGTPGRRLLRFALGVSIAVLLRSGLAVLFQGFDVAWAPLLRYLRYASVGFWAVFLAPWLFLRLKLAEPEPERKEPVRTNQLIGS